jgi:hypothetical protein
MKLSEKLKSYSTIDVVEIEALEEENTQLKTMFVKAGAEAARYETDALVDRVTRVNAEKARDIWKKACELACKSIARYREYNETLSSMEITKPKYWYEQAKEMMESECMFMSTQSTELENVSKKE